MEIFEFQPVKKFDIKKVTKSLETKSVLQSWPGDMKSSRKSIPGIDNMYLSLINLNTQIEINWIKLIFSLNWQIIIGSLLANKKQDWSKPRFKSNFKHYWVITDENLSNIRLSLCWGISLYLNNDMEQQSRGGKKKNTWNKERCCSGGAHHLVLFINNTIPEIQQWWI